MAIRATRNGWTLRAVVTSFNIPSSTLHEGISGGQTADPKLGRNSVFTPEQEESIAKHITLLAKNVSRYQSTVAASCSF